MSPRAAEEPAPPPRAALTRLAYFGPVSSGTDETRVERRRFDVSDPTALVSTDGALPIRCAVKLLDFGIAVPGAVRREAKSGTGLVIGTGGYVAPERSVRSCARTFRQAPCSRVPAAPCRPARRGRAWNPRPLGRSRARVTAALLATGGVRRGGGEPGRARGGRGGGGRSGGGRLRAGGFVCGRCPGGHACEISATRDGDTRRLPAVLASGTYRVRALFPSGEARTADVTVDWAGAIDGLGARARCTSR